MFLKLREFLSRHPAVRDALLWAVPALLFGALLRGCFLWYSPYAYWGSDSRSYFDFSYKLYEDHYLSLVVKRRFLYPIFVAIVTALPGAPLKLLPWLQHGFGLISLVPLAYIVRKNFVFWKWWVIPVTLLFASHPVALWYEHELLGETLFFGALLWAFAGWTAWIHAGTNRAPRLWWAFLIPFAIFILTKPSGRFFWPGLLAGCVVVAAWRRFGRPQWLSMASLMVATLFVGDRAQGAWLLYVATFPLTQVNTALHAEYKAQIRDAVEPLHRDLDTYHSHDGETFDFLENPARRPDRPLWAALKKDSALQQKIYFDLAKEGIRAEPGHFLLLGVHRLGSSINLSEFKENRFNAGYFAERFEDDYAVAQKRLGTKLSNPVPLALGMGSAGALPPYEEFRVKLNPAPESWAAKFVPAVVGRYQAAADFIALPKDGHMQAARPTWLGVWLLAALALAVGVPAYRPALGVWTLAVLSYLFGVFLVSQTNPRYFGAAWPVLIPLLALPLDAVTRLLWARAVKPRDAQ